MRESKLRIALLLSGGGTTAKAVIKACREKRLLGVTSVAVIASRPDALGVQKAQNLGIKSFVIQRRDCSTDDEFGEKLLAILRSLRVNLVSQNGWLPLTPVNVVEEFRGRIINQHPGPLDPGRVDFGGKGMYGARVTCARLAYEWVTAEPESWTEAVTHYVTEEYDQGDLIRVVPMRIPCLDRSATILELKRNPQQLIRTTKDVQAKLLLLEHENVIETLVKFIQGQPSGFRRKRRLISKRKEKLLSRIKKLAIELFPNG